MSFDARLTTDQLTDLLKKGLEKDIAKSVSDHLIAISTAHIKEHIITHVQKVVEQYCKATAAIYPDSINGNIVIHIEFKDRPEVSQTLKKF